MGLAFIYTMTYGGSLTALIRPFVGLLIFLVFAITCPGFGLWYWSVPASNYSQVVAFGLLLGWMFQGFGDWHFGRAKPIFWSLVGYLVWLVISATQALDADVAWRAVESLMKGLVPIIVGMTLIDSVQKLKQLAWIIVLTHGYVAYDLNMSYFNGFNRLQEVGFGYIDNNGMGASFVTCSGVGYFLAIGAQRLWQKGLAAVAVAFMTHAILISFSRGAMIGLIVVGGISFLLIPKRLIHYLSFAAVVAATFALAGEQVVERFSTIFVSDNKRDASAEGRLEMWTICLEQAAENPIVGLGPDHFPVYAHTFGLTRGKSAHTTWLQTAAELGIPGITFLLLFYMTCVARLIPWLWSTYPLPDPWFRLTARMVVASLSGFFITAQFVSLPGLEAPYYIVLLGAGALKLLSVSQNEETKAIWHASVNSLSPSSGSALKS